MAKVSAQQPGQGNSRTRPGERKQGDVNLGEQRLARLKNDWALTPLQAFERVQLHADVTILAKLARALARARAVPLAA